ncbi:PAS domain-containing protein [Methanoplanus sp. FWC-SCC4]|uniref:PAS domain-containing protein n=1 Tax=Methanochimaera problematica TaxID=2609417 RepID=A0AA97I4Q8_9EURY|nr:methyl-accepting chemotaxis protein [Methanoplanus sp. FWC-SCC4]WOF16621.1 PAS domain-containing protein [Methanoplanus sp. FWC-SCC4]
MKSLKTNDGTKMDYSHNNYFIREEKKNSENIEEENLEFLNLAYEGLKSIPTPVMLIDRDFNVTYMNGAGAELLNMEPDRITGKKCYNLFKTKDCNTPNCACQKAMNSGSTMTEETVTGTGMPIRYTGAPLRDKKGNIKGAVEFVLDITDEVMGRNAVDEAVRISQEFANNNYTARFSNNIEVTGKYEKFRDSLNEIGDTFSNVVRGVKKISLEIDQNAIEVGKGTEEIAKASEEVAATSVKNSDGARELYNQIKLINDQISDLSASNEEIAGTSQDVFKKTGQVVDLGTEAKSSGDIARKKMASVENIAKQSVDEINSLSNKVNEVGNVVRLINEITGQINLLALNAAIEAARAGEHGRGFAVVAGEVKNLAGEARAATKDIEKVVSVVQNNSEKAAKSINLAKDEIIDSVSSVNEALEALDRIILSANSVVEDIGEVSKATEDQAHIANNVVSAVIKGRDMTEKAESDSEELASLAEESSSSVEEITNAMYEVTKRTKMLADHIDQYKID